MVMSSKVFCAKVAKAKTAQRARELARKPQPPAKPFTWRDVPVEVLACVSVDKHGAQFHYAVNER